MRAPAPPDHDHAIEEIDQLLRSHDLRRTPQRHVTLEAIAELAGHATAEQIVGRVRLKLPSVSSSTVYRTLATLEEVGVICHAHLGHTASVYHVGTAGLHQHLVCERCGKQQEVDDSVTAPFAAQLTKRFGFRANFTHFAVLGECRSCAAGRTGARAKRGRQPAKASGGRVAR
jgi:Fur family transcriptional regulator, ferric uptake regulator